MLNTTEVDRKRAKNSANLPFVCKGENGSLNYWNVTETGDWEADCRTGQAYAEAAIQDMVRSGAPFLLINIVKAMGSRKQGGVETGFLTVLAGAAVAGATSLDL